MIEIPSPIYTHMHVECSECGHRFEVRNEDINSNDPFMNPVLMKYSSRTKVAEIQRARKVRFWVYCPECGHGITIKDMSR